MCFPSSSLLGTRVLHYTKHEIIFECLSSTKLQGDPALQARRSLTHLPIQTSAQLETMELEYKVRTSTKKEDVFQVWRDLVSTYTRRSLTFPTDVLSAVGGLADILSSKTNSEYLGGLWRENLLRGLLWKSAAPDKGKDLPYVAPTWGWPSLQRAVEWIPPGNRSDYLVRIDNGKSACVRKGHNQFGELISAWLFITGPVIYATISSVSTDEKSSPTAWLQSDRFRRLNAFAADHGKRCIQLIGSKMLCMRYCTDVFDEKTGSGFYRALILACPPLKELE